MKILKVIVDRIPDCCCDCTEISLRSPCPDDKNPHICGVTNSDILQTEGEKPKDCPCITLKDVVNEVDNVRNSYNSLSEQEVVDDCVGALMDVLK